MCSIWLCIINLDKYTYNIFLLLPFHEDFITVMYHKIKKNDIHQSTHLEIKNKLFLSNDEETNFKIHYDDSLIEKKYIPQQHWILFLKSVRIFRLATATDTRAVQCKVKKLTTAHIFQDGIDFLTILLWSCIHRKKN